MGRNAGLCYTDFHGLVRNLETPAKGLSLENATIQQLETMLVKVTTKMHGSGAEFRTEINAIKEELELKKEMKAGKTG